MITATYNSPLGDIILSADERGLTGLWFADGRYASELAEMAAGASCIALEESPGGEEGAKAGSGDHAPADCDPVEAEQVACADAESGSADVSALDPRNAAALSVIQRTWAWLNAYFAGQAPCWIPPLHLCGSEFQHAVWVALLSIPYGEVVSYSEVARRVLERTGGNSSPAAYARAVGSAVGRNPISLIVPCHRVIASDGDLAGYAGGIERKRALLKLEGAKVSSVASL